MQVFHKRLALSDQFMGEATVPVGHLEELKPINVDVKLEGIKHGVVRLELLLHPTSLVSFAATPSYVFFGMVIFD